jgi:large-conductance mechanosensitive channel
MIIKAMNSAKKKEVVVTAGLDELSSTDKLLIEIRDNLKKVIY